MSLIALILWWVLQLFFYALVGRLIVDLVLSANPAFRPRGVVLVLFEIIMTITDPALKLVRRFIKPIRMGAIQLDLGWTALVFAIFALQNLVESAL